MDNQPSEKEDPKNTNTNNNISKCQKEAAAAAAAEAAALGILKGYTASESTTPTGPSAETAGTSQTSITTPSIASTASTSVNGEGEDQNQAIEELLNSSSPQTLEEAMDRISKLKLVHDDLVAERDRNHKFVERYQNTVSKKERLATLSQLIPRELYVREDRYQQELEHVLKWKGISDKDIAEIYQAKLRKSGIKSHSFLF
jgi:hypothetical protein